MARGGHPSPSATPSQAASSQRPPLGLPQRLQCAPPRPRILWTPSPHWPVAWSLVSPKPAPPCPPALGTGPHWSPPSPTPLSEWMEAGLTGAPGWPLMPPVTLGPHSEAPGPAHCRTWHLAPLSLFPATHRQAVSLHLPVSQMGFPSLLSFPALPSHTPLWLPAFLLHLPLQTPFRLWDALPVPPAANTGFPQLSGLQETQAELCPHTSQHSSGYKSVHVRGVASQLSPP